MKLKAELAPQSLPPKLIAALNHAVDSWFKLMGQQFEGVDPMAKRTKAPNIPSGIKARDAGRVTKTTAKVRGRVNAKTGTRGPIEATARRRRAPKKLPTR